MSDLNFGLLQGVPLPTPGQTVYQLPVHSQSGLDSLMGGISSGLQQGQAMQLQRGQLALDQQRNAVAQQLAPSQIALAQAQAQAAQADAAARMNGVQQQRGLAALANGQQPAMPPQAMPQGMAPQMAPASMSGPAPTGAINATVQPGMTTPGASQAPSQAPQGDYNTAVTDYYKKIGRPDLAMKMLTDQQGLMEATIKNKKALTEMTDQEAKTKWEHFEHAGTIAFGLTQVPDDQAYDLYQKQYGKIINKIDPNAPKLGAGKDETLAYLHAAVSAYSQVKQAVGANPALASKIAPTKESQEAFTKTATGESKPTDTAKAQDLVTQRQQELDAAIQNSGSNSKEAQDAQDRVTEAQDAVTKSTKTGGFFEELTRPVGKLVTGVANKIGNRLSPISNKAPAGKVFTYNPKTGKLE